MIARNANERQSDSLLQSVGPTFIRSKRNASSTRLISKGYSRNLQQIISIFLSKQTLYIPSGQSVFSNTDFTFTALPSIINRAPQWEWHSFMISQGLVSCHNIALLPAFQGMPLTDPVEQSLVRSAGSRRNLCVQLVMRDTRVKSITWHCSESLCNTGDAFTLSTKSRETG